MVILIFYTLIITFLFAIFKPKRTYFQRIIKKLLTIGSFYAIISCVNLSIQNNYTLPYRVRRCIECSEHISPRNVRERWSMALEREWLLLTVEKFSREDAQKAELVSHIKIEFLAVRRQLFSAAFLPHTKLQK